MHGENISDLLLCKQTTILCNLDLCPSFRISQCLLYNHNVDNNQIIGKMFFPEDFGTKLVLSQLIQSEALWTLITSLPSHRHLFCNYPRIRKKWMLSLKRGRSQLYPIYSLICHPFHLCLQAMPTHLWIISVFLQEPLMRFPCALGIY